ncbi:MAG TPA: redox-regulated ATPase YchF [Candidatus Nanoarchaeia archaeon]|nr:redox-regulated ATPase YchF [Candidatus Nanoarchaeia archaeon]
MLIGVVGKPNCGKSTFFKASTLVDVEIANYPFATIKPNHGIGYVKIDCIDSFFKVQCNPREGYCLNHKRFVPVELLDVAGLVPDAHLGKGLGLEFLNDLNQADALIHVIDVSGSTNEKGEVLAPLSYDPRNDIRFLETELNYWYLNILKKGWDKLARTMQQDKKEIAKTLAKQLSGLKVTEEIMERVMKTLNFHESPLKWTEEDLLSLATELRILTKPMIIAANKIDIPGAYENFKKIKEEFPNYTIIPCSSESELALKEAAKHNLIEYIPGSNDFKIIKELSEQQQKGLNFIKENILQKYNSTGVQEILNSIIFDNLKYIAIFPGGLNKLSDSKGNILPDCFLMKENSTALDFAYRLHTDFGKNFIKAIDVKSKLPVGRDHKLKHLDVIEIMASK